MARLTIDFSLPSPFRHRTTAVTAADFPPSPSGASSPAMTASSSPTSSPRLRPVYFSPLDDALESQRNPSHHHRQRTLSGSASVMSSPTMTINSIVFSQPAVAGLEEERRSFGNELGILEPRPLVYWGGVEERMGTAEGGR